MDIITRFNQVSRKWLFAGLVALLFILVTVFIYVYLPVNSVWTPNTQDFIVGADWKISFRPAALNLISGIPPFNAPGGFSSPPWILLPLIPIALLPPGVGSAILFTLGLFLPLYAVYRMGAKPLVALAFIFSPQVLKNAELGNVDWLILLGAVLPPQIGLFLVMTKPQIGIGIAAYWLWKSWQCGKVKEVLRVFGPVTLAYLVSFAIYGFWLIRPLSNPTDWLLNSPVWPYAIPIGLVLLISALRSNRFQLAVISSPFLSPYVRWNSWSICLFGLVNTPLEFFAAWFALWALRVTGYL